jgi:hypothetical protein
MYSRSTGQKTRYDIQFFWAQFERDASKVLTGLSGRSRNILVPQQKLFSQQSLRVSGLIKLLNDTIPGGIASIPISSSENFLPAGSLTGLPVGQLELSLNY